METSNRGWWKKSNTSRSRYSTSSDEPPTINALEIPVRTIDLYSGSIPLRCAVTTHGPQNSSAMWRARAAPESAAPAPTTNDTKHSPAKNPSVADHDVMAKTDRIVTMKQRTKQILYCDLTNALDAARTPCTFSCTFSINSSWFPWPPWLPSPWRWRRSGMTSVLVSSDVVINETLPTSFQLITNDANPENTTNAENSTTTSVAVVPACRGSKNRAPLIVEVRQCEVRSVDTPPYHSPSPSKLELIFATTIADC